MIDNEINDRPEDFNENSLTFMYQSIADTQSIIRAIDTKLGFILVLNLVPITNIGKIFFKIQNIISTDHDPTIHLIKTVISIICIICWLIACWCIYKGISAIDNPAAHIKSLNGVSGYFYSGDLYKPKFLDATFNRKSLMSEKTFAEYFNQIPNTNIKTLKELSFEKMKLAYIRDVKLKRQLWAFRFTVYWVTLGIIIYVFSSQCILH